MNGRSPRGIRLALANCTDPAREAEFNRWYNQVHLSDMTASGLVTNPSRYERVGGEPPEARYLAIYEVERNDLDAVAREVPLLVQHLARAERIHPALEVVGTTMWRAIGGPFRTARTGRAGCAGVWLIQSRCSAPEREEEFNAWYSDLHIPDILGTGLFHTAYRFEAASPRPEQGKYLAIYETDQDPARAVDAFVREHRPRLREAGRLSPLIEVTWRGLFRRLYP